MSDKKDNIGDLLVGARFGEEYAFDRIVERYQPLIISCVSRFSAVCDPEELEQEALIALYRAACTYRPDNRKVSFGLYAKICINNSLISYLRSSERNEQCVSDEEEIRGNAVDLPDPSEDLINDENFKRLTLFVKKNLSPYEYRVFRLYIEGYRIKEIASLLNKTEKSVEGAMLRLRCKLRHTLRDFER